MTYIERFASIIIVLAVTIVALSIGYHEYDALFIVSAGLLVGLAGAFLFGFIRGLRQQARRQQAIKQLNREVRRYQYADSQDWCWPQR